MQTTFIRPIYHNALRPHASTVFRPLRTLNSSQLLQQYRLHPRTYTSDAARSLRHSRRRGGGRFIARALVIVGGTWALYKILYYRSDSRFGSEELPFEGLNEQKFTPFILARKDAVSPTSAIFSLRSPKDFPSSSVSASSTSPTNTPDLHNGDEDRDPFAPLFARGLWSVEFKQPQLQIARSYTPLPPFLSSSSSTSILTTAPPNDFSPIPPPSKSHLHFLIRKFHHGEMSSNYLEKLPLGATIELRGPKLEFEIPKQVEEVLFLAGGTGIAPALQVVHTLLGGVRDVSGAGVGERGQEQKKPRIRILWANRRREDCVGGGVTSKKRRASSGGGLASWFWASPTQASKKPAEVEAETGVLVQELQRLQTLHGSDHLQVSYFVDEEGTFINKKSIWRSLKNCSRGSRAGRRARKSSDNKTSEIPEEEKQKLIFVSGPEGFIKYFAGPKIWEDGKEVQGPVGGVLGQLGLTGWRVVKI